MNALQTCETWNDTTLLAELRAGNEDAYELLVRKHTGMLQTVARRFLNCHEECADAVQETFLAAFRALPSFEGNSALGTWLHRILVNNCLGRLRTRKRRSVVSLEGLLPTFAEDGHHAEPVRSWSNDEEDPLIQEETRQQVRKAIAKLPEAYRTVLLLRDIEEFDTEQTAELLGIAPGAVKTRLHRARQALRTLLDPVFG